MHGVTHPEDLEFSRDVNPFVVLVFLKSNGF